MKKQIKKSIGKWAFFIGIIIAFGSPFFPLFYGYSYLLLFFLGLLVGLFGVSSENKSQFLIGVIALTLFGIVGIQATSIIQTPLNLVISKILSNFSVLVISAGIVIERKVIFEAIETPNIIRESSGFER